MQILKVFSLFFVVANLQAQNNRILFFVSHEDTYYSEFIVMYEALSAAGYQVDVRSASNIYASSYMLPFGTDIAAAAASLPGGSYSQFTAQFVALFGQAWDANLNSTPLYVPSTGRIQDIADMSDYDALVIAGGTGANDYRVDGSYSTQGTGVRQISAQTVQQVAEKLNALGLDALVNGKPVLAQCHGASLPVFWRIPNTSGPGAEALGYSLLKDAYATGFPDPQTPVYLNSLFVGHRAEDRVTVASPHSSFADNGLAAYKIITTRDWYPQTVAHAAATLLNILKSYPASSDLTANKSVLILHGGALDSTNCSPSNLSNDIPCNYGSTPNFPADYTHILNLLNADSPNDEYNFSVSHLNLNAALPYNSNSMSSALNYFEQFDAIVFFKHWSTNINDSLEMALLNYADNGGGILALHHALYAHIDGNSNKNIITEDLFGAASAASNWSGNLANYNLYNSSYGHFVSTYGIDYDASALYPTVWNSNPLPLPANNSYSYLPRFAIYDEIYNNMSFTPGQTFGMGANEITPILSNDYSTASQCHSAGFVKLFNANLDNRTGKLAFYQAGERREIFDVNHRYGQLIRNSLQWICASAALPSAIEMETKGTVEVYPNPCADKVVLRLAADAAEALEIDIFNSSGQLQKTVRAFPEGQNISLDLSELLIGLYLINIKHSDHTYSVKIIKN